MCKICLICKVPKYEIDQQRKYNNNKHICITVNGRHQYKKQIFKPKIKNQLEFLIY